MREDKHTWHKHISFWRGELGPGVMSQISRRGAKDARGDHGMVKHNRDRMRYLAKMELRHA